MTGSWPKPLSSQEEPVVQAPHLSVQLSPPHAQMNREVAGRPWRGPGGDTHHTGTGSTACSLPPSPRTCRQPSACRCRSWQRQLPPTPPGTCTPARYCRMLHSAEGSCKARTQGWHSHGSRSAQSPGKGHPCLQSSGNQPCPVEDFPQSISPSTPRVIAFHR